MPNLDMRSGDYREVQEKYRPSHADYTYDAKYGVRDWRGGGRTSARETAGRVAAGAIARKLLAVRWNVVVVAWVSKVGTLTVDCDVEKVTRVQGGITNGETIYFRVAFKPTATIMREQRTVTADHVDTTIKGRGRHDPCVLPRAVAMVEAMTTLVLADHALAHRAISGDFS